MTLEQKRSIRSYVLRQGRMTPSQKAAIADLYPIYGLPLEGQPFDFDSIFNYQKRDMILEIGFGMGESLLQMAKNAPERNFIGIEVHQPGVGRLMHQLKAEQVENVRVINDDAVKVLNEYVTDNSLAGVQIYFPDPWHKKKHHKRRIVQADFVKLIVKKLKPQGFLHVATDWAPYAEHIVEVLQQENGLQDTAGTEVYDMRKAARTDTKFENRGKRLGHDIFDMIYEKK